MQKFSDYFNDWLSSYYSGIGQVGIKGDFVTSVTASGFFGATIAHYFLRRVKDEFFNADEVWFVEFGANRGLAIKDAIRYIAGEEPELIKKLKFCAIEPGEDTQEALKKTFDGFDFGQKELIVVGDFEEISAKEAFIFANEVLDCMPCELLYSDQFANVVNHKIEWSVKNDELLAYAKAFGITKGEVPINAAKFAKSFGNIKCEALFFDYGQNYARNDFSARIYQNHKTTPIFELENFEAVFAKTDITYDVNFEVWQKEFENAGFKTMSFKSQARALVDFGIDSLISKMLASVDEKTALEQLKRVKFLIAPDGFGERFKLLHLVKDGK